MTDGPNGPVIDNLADIRLELMQLNLYIRDLLTVSSRELPAPVVNVAPTPVVVEASTSPVQALNLDGLYDRLAALRGDPAGAQVEAFEKLHKQLSELTLAVRAGAMQSVASGSSFVTAQVRNDPEHRLNVRDTYTGAEYLADQEGAGAVLTFTFSQEQALAFVRCTGGTVRCATGDTTPTASVGAGVGDGDTFPLPVSASEVKVFAPAGTTVSCWGFSY